MINKFKSQSAKFKIIVAITLLTFNFTLYTTTAIAIDSTPSADIRIKLEQLKKEIASKAAKLKQEVNKKLKDKSYIGKVKTRSENTLTLATANGPKIININQDTVFDSRIKNKKYSAKSVTEEDYLAALGDVDETGVLTAKKIALLPAPDNKPKIYLWSQIIAISDKLVTVKDKNLKSIAVSQTEPASVKVNDFVILTGRLEENDIFKTDFVYVIPQGGILKSKKLATPSANISTPSSQAKRPTPSPKPK